MCIKLNCANKNIRNFKQNKHTTLYNTNLTLPCCSLHALYLVSRVQKGVCIPGRYSLVSKHLCAHL